ncbi:MAG: hypothetical protein P4N60_09290 [Verrucomicrobiae bacterium]|nr:hypothetical protein [Verrucomicrobiae bacterium]
MIKIKQFIAALQEQEKKHGDIDLSIGIVANKDVPKEGYSKYLHLFGPWGASADSKNGKCEHSFELHEDKEYGDWLELVFTKGRIDGDFERLSRKDLIREVEKDRRIDNAKT